MSIMQEQIRMELEKNEIAADIWEDALSQLYVGMRYLDTALHILRRQPDSSFPGFGTDGESLFYRPDTVLALYRAGSVEVNRACLHVTIHCLFGHLFRERDPQELLWQLACDAAAEYIIDHLHAGCVHLPVRARRREFYLRLENFCAVPTAEAVLRFLEQKPYSERELLELAQEFYCDSHSLWPKKRTPQTQRQKNRWEDAREKMQTDMETFSKESAGGDKAMLEELRVENRPRYEYRKFLKKFSVLREELHADLDSFDYIFYNYGMQLYGNMPLIEPQETREVHRVEDFVIAVDTSMSCKGELIQLFLRETYGVLSESESFFRKVNVHIIQCDEKIQEDVVITDGKELERYMEHFTVKGMGGTDFRPVFSYVNTLIAQGAFRNLRGLIYFTDGYGTFPAKRPLYETAFIFMQEDYRDVDVPPWAIKLILEPEDIRRQEERRI
ncbi:MAG TPA: metallopeptidase [Candidatus Egerieimonas faecigallinarum]|nr:metallopeptidase [Candidatus Egerieimonas faecigallinarum]